MKDRRAVGALAAVVVAAVAVFGWIVVGAGSSGPDSSLPVTRSGRTTGSIPPASALNPLLSATPPAASVGGDRRGLDGAALDPPGTDLVTMWVDVAGAVVRPGLVAVPEGARVAEVVSLAGGLAPDADRDRVNLASRVHDGARVYVPRRGEESAPLVVAGNNGSGSGGDAEPGGRGSGSAHVTTTLLLRPIDINTATVDQLIALRGVGPALAAAILDYRAQHGSFQSVDDLAQVRGIGKVKLEDLRPLVRVN